MPTIRHEPDERRDTYDSRRIDGLVAAVTELTIHVENLREDVKDCTASVASVAILGERVETLRATVADSIKSMRALRNSVVGGCIIALFAVGAERLL